MARPGLPLEPAFLSFCLQAHSVLFSPSQALCGPLCPVDAEAVSRHLLSPLIRVQFVQAQAEILFFLDLEKTIFQ
jgi:hypothetical protein